MATKKTTKSTSNKKKRPAVSKKKQETLKKILGAVKESDGLIINIASKAKLDRSTVHGYINDFPEVKEAIEEAKEKLFDTVESKLFEKIKAGDMTAIIFFAKTRMKHRGYIEKQEIEHTGPLHVIVEYEEGTKQR